MHGGGVCQACGVYQVWIICTYSCTNCFGIKDTQVRQHNKSGINVWREKKMEEKVQILKFQAEDIIIREGRCYDEMYKIISGSVGSCQNAFF